MKICFLDCSTKLKTVDDLESRPRGGMVSSLFAVTDYLARNNHSVVVLSDIETPGVTSSGVWWCRHAGLDNGDGPPSSFVFDVLVMNRGVDHGHSEIPARHRILWTHDLPHSGFSPNPKTLRALSATVFMSRYAERIWRTFYKDIGKSFLIPNGIDRSIFFHDESVKDLRYLIYASAPNRGLKRLPFIFDSIRSRVGGDVQMRAYSNLGVLHPNEVGRGAMDDGFSDTYNAVAESAVDRRDPVPQPVLAHELRRAGLMILPSDYPEICSNIVLQALACGVPIITTGKLGSAHEWVCHGVNGFLTEFQPVDYMVYQLEMIRHAVTLLENQSLHARMIRDAARTPIYSWEEIGSKWERMLRRII